MAFKSMKTYNAQRYDNMFLLRNDGDYADVVILYRSYDDVLGADAHYIKSSDYSGYVHCCGAGCPACGKNIRVQPKLFIPVYNIIQDKIQFWDRSMRFDSQLQQDVFANYPDPSNYIFRITRKGVANDINTVYTIQCVGRNSDFTYEAITTKFSATFPDYYSNVIRDYSPAELSTLINTGVGSEGHVSPDAIPEYKITPRVSGGINTFNQPIPPAIPVPGPANVPVPEIPVPVVGSDEPDPDSNETIDDEVDF